MTDEKSDTLKFAPFSSCIDPSFWHRITQLKLDVDRLNENAHQIWGYYSNKKPEGLNGLLSVDCSSFNKEPDENRLIAFGTIDNKNTIEKFKEEDKTQLLKNEGKELLNIIKEKAVEQPFLLTKFFVTSFADLKKYHYYYWFAFPAPNFLSSELINPAKGIAEVLNLQQINTLCDLYFKKLDVNNKGFFFVKLNGDNVEVYSVKEGLSNIKSDGEWIFGFADSCERKYPGWPLRNYLAFISYHCPDLIKKPVRILSLKLCMVNGQWQATNSSVFTVQIKVNQEGWEKAESGEGWVGWEKNEKGRLLPRIANLSNTMDPVRLAEISVDLNLKLMKWQLLPDLDLDIVKKSKCLLLGAGTLGCAVGRNLMSWGVREITFVDYGKISYSNPVRQSLYKFSDCGKLKAEVAASALKEIFPGMKSAGIILSIPMPGHPVGESLLEETKKNVEKLEELIDLHDVIFLLMDSRESRWLPSLIAAAKGKLVINAALGFDSYLVMRHGYKNSSNEQEPNSSKLLSGSQLGCYFCNDVTAPGNSGKQRTLDQQCTVTRPGVSNMAGALAVELFVSILQHPLKGLAPAESDQDSTETSSLLGIIPHSIRGFISHYQTVLPATEAFTSCVACSEKVITEYIKDGFNFIMKALESKEYLEDLTGLTILHDESLMSEILEYSGSESEEL